MASLYEQLMASKGAPKAAAASNSTQLRKAPMSLRSAMRKYAAGGDVTDTAPDYSRAYGALGGAESVNNLRNQFLQSGIDENTIGSIFSKYYAPEPQPQAMMPPEPVRPPPPEEPRYQPPQPPEKPIYEEPRLYEEPRRPERPDMPEIYPQDYAGIRTTGTSQPQETGPRTSYRINDDGSRTEIGYDGQPIANYTPAQLAMHNATTGVTPSEYRYVWNGEGYTKVPNGPQIGYNPEENVPPPPREDPREDPRFYEPEMPMPEPEMPMPEIYPQYPEEPVDYTKDPGILQPQEPVYNPVSKRGGDLAKLIADMLARNGGGGSLEEQRRLMELLGSIRG